MKRTNLGAGVVAMPQWAEGLFPLSPPGWTRLPYSPLRGDFCYRYDANPMSVICSAKVEADGKRWLHVSVARPSKTPNYADMCRVRDDFLGTERKAIHVFVPPSEHYNYHKHCLHLWSCLDGDGLPDFRNADGSV